MTGVVIALLGMLGTRSLAADVSLLANDRLPKTDKAQSLRDNISVTARGIRNLGLFDDPAVRAAEKKRLSDMRAENGKLLEELDKIVPCPRAASCSRPSATSVRASCRCWTRPSHCPMTARRPRSAPCCWRDAHGAGRLSRGRGRVRGPPDESRRATRT